MKISPKDGNVALSFCENCDMLFNSFIFLVFFAVCFMLFWIGMSKKKGVWNEFLLLSSYFFYAWWDWRFLGLVVFSSVVDISKVPQLSTDSVYVFRKLIRQEVRLLQLESLAI
jgi:D-alanyl-lipoteichoic acid acyltransferase DltB (MBOAT superfamily)